MVFAEPPLRIDFTLRNPKVKSKGAMQTFLGPQFDSMEIEKRQEVPECTGDYRYLRAFPVLPLWGARFSVERDSELSLSVRDLLNRQLAPIEFENTDVSAGPLRKYFFVHSSVPAPEDEATGQAMAIELYASLRELTANDLSGPYERELADLYTKAQRDSEPLGLLAFRIHEKYFELREYGYAYIEHELLAHMEFQVTEAVYSNIGYPNITGGFYL